MLDTKGLMAVKAGLNYAEARSMVKKNTSLIMRRPIHSITLGKAQGGNKKIYGYGVSHRVSKNDLGCYWLTPLVYKGDQMLHTIAPALHSVLKIGDDDMARNDWEVLSVKRWSDVNINECD
jgi:hypothetical protein